MFNYKLKFNLDRKPLILIVDDVLENLQVLASMLYEKDIDIAFATNGHKALEIVSNTVPDLILLDIYMPEMDGFAVCRQIKSNPYTQDIPIIFLTASNQSEDIVKAFENGGVDYVTKPFNAQELISKISTHLELKLFREYFKTQRKLPKELINRLKELVPVSENLKNNLIISKVKEFGEELKKLGTQHTVQDLIKYGSDLIYAANFINIEKISTLLSQYTDMVNSLAKGK